MQTGENRFFPVRTVDSTADRFYNSTLRINLNTKVYPVNELIPLQFLNPGQTARIGQLVGPPDAVHRLEELGLRLGAEVEMVQMGAPCMIRLAGHKLCFRDSEALQVLVVTSTAAGV
jgi:Fe2+ transport system protein FeoA